MNNKPFKKFGNYNQKVDRPHITTRKPDEKVISRLFSLVSEGNINKIRNAMSINNTTFDLRNDNGESLIHAAILSENKNINDDDKYHIVKYLIDNGAPVSLQDSNNIIPLHIAAKQQNNKLVSLLIESGSMIDHKNNQNMTPLHYATQADIFSCKKKTKVKSIIPENPNHITNDMKQLTITIIDILNTKIFSQYIKSMSNHISNMHKMDFFVFDDIKDKSSKLITQIITNDTDMDKISKIEKHGANIKLQVTKELQNKLTISMGIFDIHPGHVEGEGPTENINDKILPKNTYLTDIENDINRKSLKLNESGNTLNTLSRQLESDINSCFMHIYRMFEQNWNMYYNRNIYIKGVKPFINEEQILIPQKTLVDLVTHAKPSTVYLELTLDKSPVDDDSYKLPLPLSYESVVRGTKEIRNFWNQQGIHPRAFPLTKDLGHRAVGSNIPDIKTEVSHDHGASVPYDMKTLTSKSGLINVNYGDIKYYFITKISIAIQRIKLHVVAFNKNLEVLNNHMANEYYGKIHSDIIPSMCINIIEICQNMISIDKEKQYTQHILSQLQSEYSDLFQSNREHPYSYCLEYAHGHVNSISKFLNNIFSITSTNIYPILREVFISLNNVIDIVNMRTSYKSIEKLFSTFDDTQTHLFEKLWDRTVSNIKVLPNTFDMYKKSINYDTINLESDDTIKEMRKQIIEKYIPSVNPYNFGSFITNAGISGSVDTDKISKINNEISGFDEVYHVGESFSKNDIDNSSFSLTVGNIATPETGFLVLPNLGKHNTITLPIDGYGRDNDGNLTKNITSSNKLQATTNIKGNFGMSSPYTSDKKTAIAFNLGNNLDSYIALVKYKLIQNIINAFHDNSTLSNETVKAEIQNTKDKLINTISSTYGFNTNVDSIMYTIVGKVANEIILNHINHSVQKSSIDISLNMLRSMVPTAEYELVLESIKGGNSTFVNVPDTGFKLNFTVLFDDIISDFLSPSYNGDLNRLTYGSITIKDKIDQLPQEIIYDKNYNQENDLSQNECYRSNPDIIDILIKNGASVNAKDQSKMTPIFYAIHQLNVEIVKKLIENNSYVNTVSVQNESGLTPLHYAVSLYKEHNKYLHTENGIHYKGIIERMYNHFTDSIKNELLSKSEFKNNVVENFELCFPQLLIMMNNLLYCNMTSYTRNWSYNDQEKLCKLMVNSSLLTSCDKTNIPILNLTDEEVISIFTQDTSLHVLSKQKSVMEKKRAQYKLRIEELTNQYESFALEIKNEKRSADQVFLDYLKKQQKKINDSIKVESQNLKTFEQKLVNLSGNIDSNAKNKAKEFQKNRKNFMDNINQRYISRVTINKSSENVTQFYKNIFNHVVNNVVHDSIGYKYTGYENYKGYNEIWKHYISNEEKLETIDNVHLSLIKLEDFLLTKIEQKRSDDITYVRDDFEIINKAYKDIVLPFAQDYFDGSNNKLSENYALSSVVKMITHVIRHVISSNMYLAIIKVIAKYIMSITPDGMSTSNKDEPNSQSIIFTHDIDDSNIRPEYISQMMDIILKNNSSKLATYIIGYVPKKIVKYILEVYDDDYDSVKELTSIKNLFDPILDIISANTVINASDTSSLIRNLTDHVFPYYEEVYVAIIPKLKIMIDNYCRLMINQSKYIEIIDLLLHKSQLETK